MILDIIIIALLIGGLVNGYRAGFITQSVRIVSLILSFMVAIYYFQPAANLSIALVKKLGVTPSIQWIYIADIVAFVVLFAVTHTVYLVLGGHLNGIAKIPGFHLGNALLGSVVGGLTQYLIIFFVLNMLIVFPISWLQNQYQQSSISQTIVKKTPVLSDRASQSNHSGESTLVNDPAAGLNLGGTNHEVA